MRALIHAMQMDQSLPESAEQTAAALKLNKTLRAACNALNAVPRTNVHVRKEALRELERLDVLIHKLEIHAKRFGRRQLQKV